MSVKPFIFILSVELLALRVCQEPNCKDIGPPNLDKLLDEVKIKKHWNVLATMHVCYNSVRFSFIYHMHSEEF